MAQKKPRFWKSLPKEDKQGIVKALLEAGYTCSAIGRALGTSKNAVVGYQHIHLRGLTHRTRGSFDAVPNGVLEVLLRLEWPMEADVALSEVYRARDDAPETEAVPREVVRVERLFEPEVAQRTASRTRAPYQLTNDPEKQCRHFVRLRGGLRKQCSYEKMEGSDYCPLHQ